MLVIDDELKEFLESPLAVMVGTRNEDLAPETCRAWGTKIQPDGTSVELLLDLPPAAQTLANLRSNGRIAVIFSHPLSNRSIQLKGRCVELGDPRPDDWQRVDQHRQGFVDLVKLVGYPPSNVRNLWSTQITRLRFSIEEGFDQTPRPGAGAKL